ncbi:MAG: iron-sulfur cluster assembly accessory protein [Deltaproteobacteria bacterium]|nr:iron-sulfur cluster assembly accessory protein [Deltaproteobacteria bacterium]
MPAITVTERAAKHIREALEKRGTPDQVLRVAVKGGGCSGFSYHITYAEKPGVRDAVFERNGVRVVVDPKSLIYLDGTELDWVQTLMQSGYQFNNPQVKASCGCGESFQV